MKVVEKIERKINKINENTPFKYQQLELDRSEYYAAAKAIERLIKKGLVKRVSNGIFYKPKKSIFGELKPGEHELLEQYLFQDGKRIAYVTGISLYNRLMMTTQVPSILKVASKVKRITVKIGVTQIKPVKSYVDVTDENYYLLEILDAIKDFKNIPDLDVKLVITRLLDIINGFSKKDISRMIKYSLQYPPRVRALLGALLEFSGKEYNIEILKINLNPLTKFKLGIKKIFLPTIEKWNIT